VQALNPHCLVRRHSIFYLLLVHRAMQASLVRRDKNTNDVVLHHGYRNASTTLGTFENGKIAPLSRVSLVPTEEQDGTSKLSATVHFVNVQISR
jgi:hypothetical protein